MRPAFLRWLVQRPLLIAVVIAATAAWAHAQKKCCQPDIHLESGLSVTSFETPGGPVRVYLPDDMAAGDTISGTVVGGPQAQPGQTPGPLGELTGYVVEVEGQRPAQDGRATFHVPAAASRVMLVLRDKGGQELARQAVPVLPVGQAGKGGYCATHSLSHANLAFLDEYREQGPGFGIPVIAQAGRPLGICGPFDGNLGNTSLMIGGQAARALAESPRQAIFQAPLNAAGRQALELSENGRQLKGQLQLLAVKLSAPKTTLQRGESTTLTVMVSGLQGLPQAVPLELVNRSTNVVTLEGGESQVVPIDPIPGQDELAINRTVTGVQPGTYDIRAQVKIETAPGSSAPAGGSKPPVSATGPGQSSAPAPGSAAEGGPQVATTPGSDLSSKTGDKTKPFCVAPFTSGSSAKKSVNPLLCRGSLNLKLVARGSDYADLWATFTVNPTEAGEGGEKLLPGACGWPDKPPSFIMPTQFIYELAEKNPLLIHRASMIEHCTANPSCVVEVCVVLYPHGPYWPGPDVWFVESEDPIQVLFPKF